MTPEDGIQQSATESMQADTMLFGRTTYDMFESYWPNALKDPQGAEDPHHKGVRNDATHKMAEFINRAKKVVYSKKRKDAKWQNSELKHEFDPGEIRKMKEQPGQDILVFGSGSIASKLAENDLIDEYHFVVSPVILGEGKKLIHDVRKQAKLKLAESKSFPSGVVMLKFQRENGKAN